MLCSACDSQRARWLALVLSTHDQWWEAPRRPAHFFVNFLPPRIQNNAIGRKAAGRRRRRRFLLRSQLQKLWYIFPAKHVLNAGPFCSNSRGWRTKTTARRLAQTPARIYGRSLSQTTETLAAVYILQHAHRLPSRCKLLLHARGPARVRFLPLVRYLAPRCINILRA
jgi:hypothetical protein